MRAVVTGAAGRIGRGVATALRERGHTVVGVDMASAPPGLLGTGCDDFVTIDLAAAVAGQERECLTAAMDGADVVVHCAAWPGPSATPPPAVVASGDATKPPIGLETAPPAVLLRDNVASTSAVCDAAIAGGASRFVFSSSAFAMGFSHVPRGPQAWSSKVGYLPVDEAHGAQPHESYGLSKLAGEEILETAARTATDTSFVSLRFTNIVKRELWSSLPWEAPTSAEPLQLVLWAYVHEDDVIRAHVAAATREDAAARGSHEAYLLAAPDSRFAEPTLPLLASVLGVEGMPLRSPMEGNASVLCARKATERLGVEFRAWSRDRASSRDRAWSREREASQSLVDASPPPPRLVGNQASSPPPPPPPPPPSRGSPAARRALSDPEVQHFDLAGFELACGHALPAGATLAYKVHGPPVGASKGVILHPTSFDAVHDELEYSIGEGQTLDTSAYTVVVPNLLGNGVSYSPSRMRHAERLAGYPPLLSIGDNVRAQHLLLEHLHAARGAPMAPLSLVYGYSMGALQAYEWAVAHPDHVERIAAVCGAARCGELNGVFLRSIEEALKADAAWDASRGHFTTRPDRGLRAFGSIYAGWGVGAGWYTQRGYASAGFECAEAFVRDSYLPAFANCDADDLLSQIRTWRHADVSRHTGGDLAAALGRVRARVLLMPCDEDRYFTLGEAQHEAALLGERATLRPIVSAAGHRAGDPHRPELAAEAAFIRRHVHELLSER